ncbi:MAG: two-component regulator propeller domain-containing protein, partial [Pseudobacter sp.]|uniref:two-component regulator propeller domain-containing protein n=1 Tax=Pseudobacter sp. TaxID=2045420 RepID=UPI003F81EBDE
MRGKLFLFFLLLTANQMVAQSLHFRHLTTAEGLLSDQRLRLSEDLQGRIWIASDEGVNVFDGQELTSYSYPDNSGLQHNNVTSIFCDSRGTIWISHNSGIQYFRAGDQHFRTVRLPAAINNEGLLFGETAAGILVASRSGCFIIDSGYQARSSSNLTRIIGQNRTPICMEQVNASEWLWGCADSLLLINVAEERVVRSFAFPNAWALCKVKDDQWMVGSFSRQDLALLQLKDGSLDYINHWAVNDG